MKHIFLLSKAILRHYLVLLLVSIGLVITTKASAQNLTDGLLTDEVPQAISPTAMEMGRYGRYPVSFFTGTPQISVPLTELRAKGRTLPVYLTYHSGGNKPDVHPGWVGLGWTLHCGGSITRVVNNMKDEMVESEYETMRTLTPDSNPGFLYNAAAYQAFDWTNTNNVLNNITYFQFMDTEPDEFLVSVDGLQASFFVISQNDVRIKSKGNRSFKVSFEYDNTVPLELYHVASSCLTAPNYCNFASFTITTDDGTVYHFGGNNDAIEYSVRCKPNPEGNDAQFDADRFVGGAIANTWHLTSIDYPDGERIEFSYERDGTPVQRIDSHYLKRSQIVGSNYMFNDDTRLSSDSYENVSFMLMKPSYLRSVRCVQSKDSLIFNRQETVELHQELLEDELEKRTYTTNGSAQSVTSRARMRLEDKYFQLSSITGARDSIALSFTSNTNTRLKLQRINLFGSDGILTGSYGFTYNSQALPESYRSRQTDRWGYYNGKSYANVAWNTMNSYRSVDSTKVKAEMLTTISYPAGGYSEFTYESNTYSRIQHQDPDFSLETTVADSLAGGLRIRKIRDYAADGSVTTRLFEYKLASGRSSGVASGMPSSFEEIAIYVDNLNIYLAIGSETAIRPLSSTDGAQVTYDRVTEIFPDGGRKVYEYSNHGTTQCSDRPCHEVIGTINGKPFAYPFSSLELSRGNLLSVKNYDGTGALKVEESMTYQQDTLQFVKAFGQRSFADGMIFNAGYYKEYTYWPALATKTTTVYPDGGGSPIVETTTYNYNEHRLPIETTRTRGVDTETTALHYSSDVPAMAALSLNNRITGREVSRNGWLVSAIKQDYQQVPEKARYAPWHYYKANLSTPTDTASFHQSPSSYYINPDVTVTKVDSLCNIVETLGRDSVYTTYAWTADGVNLAGLARNVRNNHTFSTTAEDHTYDGDIAYMYAGSPSTPVASFYLEDSGYVTFFFDLSDGQDWGVTLSVDGTGGGSVLLASHGIEENESISLPDYSLAHDQATILLGSGWHTVRVLDVDSNITDEGEQSEEPMLTYEAGWTESIVTESGYDGFMYEDLENNPGTCSFVFYPEPGISYILDYRVRRNGIWEYVRQNLGTAIDNTYSINEGQNEIDWIRVFPETADVMTYTYSPNIGVTSATDSRGVTESYDYDVLGRLTTVRDNDGNPVRTYQYSYATDRPGEESKPNKTYILSGIPTGVNGASPRETVQYYDGLGRPVQIIQKGASITSVQGTPADIADYQEYDANDRPVRRWLPVSVTTGANGTASAYARLTDISTTGWSIYGDVIRYSETVYDGSPLDFATVEYGPGNAWRTANKGVRTERLNNDTSGGRLTCKRTTLSWTGNTTYEVGAPSIAPSASLSILSKADEDGRESLVFTDIYGNTVLERRVDTTAVSQDYRFLDTWYLYDSLGRLEAVFPPELSAALSALSNPTASQLEALPVDEFAYLYRYDARGRCIAKKHPGCGWTYYVYDMGDRPVLSQDAEQRKTDKWTFSLQDALGRLCVTGSCTGTWNAFADALGDVQVKAEYAGETGALMGYDVSGITMSNAAVLSVNYFDSYGFITEIIPFAKRTLLAYQNPVTGCDGQYTTSASGLPTGSVAKVLGKEGESMYLYAALYYDAKGHIVQERKTDHLGGGQTSQNGYAFTGEPTHRRVNHIFANGTTMTEDYAYTYDAWGRLLSTTHAVGSGTPVTLSTNSYDAVGRLSRIDRAGNTTNPTTYSYNVRSWLTGQTGPYSEALGYHWSGNVSSRQWAFAGENVSHSYSFVYDGVSRLSGATYSGPLGWDYSTSYTYDRNSNVKTLLRKGLRSDNTYGNIDNIAYTYNGNQLTGSNNTIQTSYDDKGRMISDSYNQVYLITYNNLDLPELMDFGSQPQNPRNVRYWYGSDGVKLRSETNTSSGSTKYDYAGNLIFVRDTLRTVLIDGGYIEVDYQNGSLSSPQYTYMWYIKDHLGSNCAVMDASGNLSNRKSYYPYGREMDMSPYANESVPFEGIAPSGSSFRFSSKEFVSQGNVNWYDFGARWYDSYKIRWTTQDPLAEKYYGISPYVYCAANPVNLVDPEGKDWFFNSETGDLIRHVDNDSDYIVLITPDQIQENMSDKYLMGLVKVFGEDSNLFSNLWNSESKSISDAVAKNIFSTFWDFANSNSETDRTSIIPDRITLTFINTSIGPPAQIRVNKKELIINRNQNEFFYWGFDLINLFAHELGHLVDYHKGTLKAGVRNPSNEVSADNFSKQHWSYKYTSKRRKNDVENHIKSNSVIWK